MKYGVDLHFARETFFDYPFKTWKFIPFEESGSSNVWGWKKMDIPQFTQRDIEGNPLAMYGNGFMGMPVKEFLKLTLAEDAIMLDLERKSAEKYYKNEIREIVIALENLNK